MNPWIRTSGRVALRRSLRWFRLTTLVVAAGVLTTCSPMVSELERLKELGRLRVVSRNAATSFFLVADGQPAGVDFDLVERFADRLGLVLEFVPLDSVSQLIPTVRDGLADIAAAHITVTDERAHQVRFGPAVQRVSTLAVYKRGRRRPRKVEDLGLGRIGVVAGSSHLELLQRLQLEHPDLTWEALPAASVEELFEAVEEEELEFALTDSSAYRLNRRYYPEVRTGFTLGDAQPIAWAFPPGRDRSVLQEAQRFFLEMRLSGELDQVLDRYYEHTDTFDWVGTRTFLRHIDSRLPRFEALFHEAAAEVNLDWHLLAATAYQESHWDPNAVSPTKVRGLMMLTEATATQLGIDDRTSPRESVLGGARYLAQLRERIDETIPEPDRTFMALAAYNVGYGHLQDARTITEMRDGDPNVWADVRDNLPLLTRRKWYSQVPRGYARGRQPVEYVRNIRLYYDILLWKRPDVELALAPEEVVVEPLEGESAGDNADAEAGAPDAAGNESSATGETADSSASPAEPTTSPETTAPPEI